MRVVLGIVAWLAFLVTSLAVRMAGFTRVHGGVRRWRVSSSRRQPSTDALREAIEAAARWTLFPVQCLERAVVTTCLFRAFGYDATFVIGVRRTPFYAHAWSELGGAVLTDPVERVRDLVVLERC
jgi:hypothetical protein